MDRPPGRVEQVLMLALFLFICFAVAGLGGLVTSSQVPHWYRQLAKPPWSPPDWVFGPVWTLLYAMMAVAAWLVWRWGGFARTRIPLLFFAGQLVLNLLWSVIFFGLHRPGFAALELTVLWVMILVTLILFWRRVVVAGLLLVPYLLWVSFAGVLNVAIWWLNR